MFDKLQEGTCTLEIRILPDGKGQEAIADIDKFKDYSPLGEDIQTDERTSSKDYHKMTFKVSQSPSRQQSAFEFVKPFESDSICIENSATELPIRYVLQTSDDEDLEKSELDYVLTIPGYGAKADGDINLKANQDSTEKIDISDIVTTLKGKGSEEVKLTYDVTLIKKDSDDEDTKSNSINFYLTVPKEGSSCSQPAYEEPPKEKDDGNDTTGDVVDAPGE